MALDSVPFKFSAKEEDVADLRARIKSTRLPSEAVQPLLDGWDYGTNLEWLRRMVRRWHDNFDFKAFNDTLQKWPQFIAPIEELKIHFIHVKSKAPNAIPLLLVHGWPGSFLEFRHLIDRLTNPASSSDPAFHVVVPSIPGYGFSELPSQRGWTMYDNARIFNKLMIGLGYSRYVCQGGDWGHQVCRYLGSCFTDNCNMVHLNMCPAPVPQSFNLLSSTWIPLKLKDLIANYLYTPVEKALCQRSKDFGTSGIGYAQIQGTRPATIGYALLDSPVGHLCWLGEKWIEWSDTVSPSEKMFAEPRLDLLSDDILFNVSLYWFTKTILSSFIPYLENRDQRFSNYSILNLTITTEKKYYISVPMGVSSFKHELAGTTRSKIATTGQLKFYKEHSEGGHFAALDRPDELLEDFLHFIRANNEPFRT